MVIFNQFSRRYHVAVFWRCIRLSEKFLSFYEEIIDAQRFLFYISLSNILFCWDKYRDISQTWFHVCMKMHCCKKHVCERKTLFGQPNSCESELQVIVRLLFHWHYFSFYLGSILLWHLTKLFKKVYNIVTNYFFSKSEVFVCRFNIHIFLNFADSIFPILLCGKWK